METETTFDEKQLPKQIAQKDTSELAFVLKLFLNYIAASNDNGPMYSVLLSCTRCNII